MTDSTIDCMVDLVNRYLENEWEPTARKVYINSNEYIAYTINGYPFILDPLELVFKAMEEYEKEQDWKVR